MLGSLKRNIYFKLGLVNIIRPIIYFVKYRLVPEKLFLILSYRKEHGYYPNLNKPKTFSEKIQWLKLYERTPLHTICADKFQVRKYVEQIIGKKYLIPLFFYTNDIDRLEEDELPDFPFIVKPNHCSGIYHIVRDKTEENWKEIRRSLKKILRTNYYYKGKEWQYKNIKPMILIEKLLLDSNGEIPADYKFHCSNNEVIFIQADLERERQTKRSLFDADWNLISGSLFLPQGGNIKPPKNLELMKKLSLKLAKNFSYARVDFYEHGGNIFFGEITFHPGGGYKKFKPFKLDLDFGEKIILRDKVYNEKVKQNQILIEALIYVLDFINKISKKK